MFFYAFTVLHRGSEPSEAAPNMGTSDYCRWVNSVAARGAENMTIVIINIIPVFLRPSLLATAVGSMVHVATPFTWILYHWFVSTIFHSAVGLHLTGNIFWNWSENGTPLRHQSYHHIHVNRLIWWQVFVWYPCHWSVSVPFHLYMAHLLLSVKIKDRELGCGCRRLPHQKSGP